MKSLITVGEQTPDFTLIDQNGEEWQLSKHLGRVVVLLFYPRDETPVCTRQMCSLRDRWPDYRATGAEVAGVSTDPPESHRKFAEHHHLPLHLLSDPGGKVARMFGASSWIPGRAARAVVVIGADGTVRHLKTEPLSLFRPSDDQVLAAIRAAQGV